MELAIHEFGNEHSRDALLCIHDTGETSAAWARTARLVARALPHLRVITYDRRGWGESGAPEPYSRTTVQEQARDAIALLDHLGVESVWICGDGLGAVVALDILVREPEAAIGVVAIEPPLLSFSTAATEGLSADVKSVTEAAERGGLGDAVALFERGELGAMFPGSERIPRRDQRDQRGESPAARRPVSLFAEASAVPSWEIPFAGLAQTDHPVNIVTGTDSPDVLNEAASSIVTRISGAHRVELHGDPRSEPELSNLLVDALTS